MNFNRPTIELTPWEYEWASHVGARRYIENWGRNDAAHYNRERMEDDRTAQVAACVCELAIAKYTNTFWSGHVWHVSEHAKHRELADVGNNIEVRRLRTKETAAVRRKQLGKNLVLFVAKSIMPECRRVIVYGYRDYDEAWSLAVPSEYDPQNTRELGPEFLQLIDP